MAELKVLPAGNRRTPSTPAEQETVRLAIGRITPHLPTAAVIQADIGDPVAAGTSLPVAHRAWTEPAFAAVATPTALRRQPLDARTPAGLIQVDVCCVNEWTPGMGSHFGFRGYFLSVLLDLDSGEVWDARGEKAK